MKQNFKYKVIAVLMLFCILLCSCKPEQQKNKYTAHSFDYFDTVATITGYETSQAEFDKISNEIFSQLAEYHKLYTIYHRFDGMENLCTINEVKDGAHRTVKVDRRIIDMLLYAKEMYNKTDGMLNIAMGSVLSLWHDYRTIGKDNPENASLPPMAQLLEAAKHTDIDKVLIDEENLNVTLTDPLMKLDVGAIAKGYATEQIALYLEEKGVTGYLLNIGGNVRAIGSKPDGSDWLVGIENANRDDYLAYLEIADKSVVTSGSYQRYYTVDGKRYHHIIHPDTQMPATEFTSVSILCKDSGLGDALSTAIFCMPLEKGKTLIESMNEVEAMWLSVDGNITVSSGWNKYIKKQKEVYFMLENFLSHYKDFLYRFSELAVYTLELIGILIIVIGSIRALVLLVKCLKNKKPFHVVVDLGKALSLALEFKMGAEIIKTVIVHNLEELSILGVVILIRALLAFIIHWEIKAEEKDTAIKERKEKLEIKE